MELGIRNTNLHNLAMPSWINDFPFDYGAFICYQFKTLLRKAKFGKGSQADEYSTIILFRTFDIFSYDRSYKLYASDSLLGRIKTKDVIIVDTYDKGISLQATTKGPSLNADKRTNYQKRKGIRYPITLKPGQVYFVKCGYLTQNIFDLPTPANHYTFKDRRGKKVFKETIFKKKN